jgi:hypothetical protein
MRKQLLAVGFINKERKITYHRNTDGLVVSEYIRTQEPVIVTAQEEPLDVMPWVKEAMAKRREEKTLLRKFKSL